MAANQPGAPNGQAQEAAPQPVSDSGEVAEEPQGGAGVTPIEIVPRIELRQSFLRVPNGIAFHDTTLDVDIQFLERVLLIYEVPYRLMDAGQIQLTGFGDLQVEALGIVASQPRYLVAVIIGAVLDTASRPQLGAGKQQVFFGGGAAVKPRPWWLAFAVAQEQLSVAGDSGRPDVNQLTADAGSVLFGKRYNWLRVDLVTTVNFPAVAGRFFGTLEAGSLLIGRVGLFMRAGTQLLGQRQVDYSLAGGVRYLFQLGESKPKAKTR